MGRRAIRSAARRRGQARLQQVLLFLSVLVVAAGLWSRWQRPDGVHVDSVAAPTATAVAAAFDETMETRELALP